MNTWKDILFKHQKPKRHIRKQDSANSSCVVSGSLALVLRVSTRLAMTPLSVTRASAGWRFAPLPKLAVVQRSLMSVFNIVMLVGLGWDLCLDAPNRVRAGESTMKTAVWICDLFLMMLIANMATYTGISRMESFVKVLKQLQQIHLSLKISPPSVKSEKMRSSVIICLLVWVTVLQLADIYNLTLAAFKEDKMYAAPIMSMSITYNYATIMEVIVELQWYHAASGAHAAAAALNQQLGQLRDVNLKSDYTPAQDNRFAAPQSVLTLVNGFMTPRKNDGAELPKPQAQATLRRLAVSFDRISEVVMQLNAGSGLLLLLMVMSNSLRLVLSPYYLLLSIFDDDDVVASVVVLQGNWIVFHIIKLLLVVEPCHWTQEEKEHTELLLSQLTVHLAPQCDGVSKDLDQFARQVTLNRAQFMPLGISTLCRPLIVTILSSVTTYLIIMIQFEKISTQL